MRIQIHRWLIGVCLSRSESFDKVWCNGLICKSSKNQVFWKSSGIMLKLFSTCSNLSTNIKLVADDSSLFSAVNDAGENFENLSNHLCVGSEWIY